MGFFASLLVGILAGWIAGKLMRGGGFGLIGNLVVGILGAIIGRWLLNLLDRYWCYCAVIFSKLN